MEKAIAALRAAEAELECRNASNSSMEAELHSLKQDMASAAQAHEAELAAQKAASVSVLTQLQDAMEETAAMEQDQ